LRGYLASASPAFRTMDEVRNIAQDTPDGQKGYKRIDGGIKPAARFDLRNLDQGPMD